MLDISRALVSWRSSAKYHSAALRSNAFHFAGDMAASLAVLAGVVAVRSGFGQGDSIAWLEVIDDGQGFDAAGLQTGQGGGHFGLRLMRDLADHAHGALKLRSSPGHGTSVRLEVPLP